MFGGRRKAKIYSDEEIQSKISGLTPEMQAAFLRAADQLFQHESEVFLMMLAESRMEIADVSGDINSEQRALRATSAKLETDRGHRRSVSERLSTPTQVTYESENDREAVQSYLKAVGREKTAPDLYRGRMATPGYARPVTSDGSRPLSASDGVRPGQAYKMRLSDLHPSDADVRDRKVSTPITVHASDERSMLKEKDLLLERLKSQGEIVLSERERQANIVRKKKEARLAKKQGEQEIAFEMIGQTKDVDEIQEKNKERQDQLVKERLERKRREREKTFTELRMQSISQDDWENSASARRRSIRLESLSADDAEAGLVRKAISTSDLAKVDELAASPIMEQPKKEKKKKKSSRSKSQPRSFEMEERMVERNDDPEADRITRMFEVNETGLSASASSQDFERKKKKKKKKTEEGHTESDEKKKHKKKKHLETVPGLEDSEV